MIVRKAACGCGQLSAVCQGEPVRISVCHCLDCLRRTGGAFSVQARWPEAQVVVSGEASTWVRITDSGGRATFRFCPTCGATVAYVIEGLPGLVAVPVGFADPDFPPPRYSVYEERKHAWTCVLGDDVDRAS